MFDQLCEHRTVHLEVFLFRQIGQVGDLGERHMYVVLREERCGVVDIKGVVALEHLVKDLELGSDSI